MRLIATTTELRIGNSTLFEAVEGAIPYVYTLAPDLAGGSIDANTGLYVAPLVLSDDPRKSFDTVIATDTNGETAQFTMNILSIEQILASIIGRELLLADAQITLQNQKFTVPNDDKLYISIVIIDGKPFANNRKYIGDAGSLKEIQTLNIREMVSINILSSSTKALRERHSLIMSLNGSYAQAKQERHSFSISKVPVNFTNLSNIEGATIPYEFNLTIALTYGITKMKDVDFYDDFQDVDLKTNQ